MYILLSSGMFAEMERLGTNLNDIDTTDCDYSLESLQVFILIQFLELTDGKKSLIGRD